MTQPPRRLYLLYHELRPRRSNYSYVVETGEFEKHIDLYLKLRETQEPGLWPEITFDDGHISNFEFAPAHSAVARHQARFFITVGWTGQRPGYMGWQELRALHQAGQHIGAHGWSHALLTHCNAKELHSELVDARLTLEDKLGTSITTMSLPGGRYNRRILAACQEAGYTQIYTSIPRAEPEPAGPTVGRLEHPRRHVARMDHQTSSTRQQCSIRPGAAISDESSREVGAGRPAVRKALGASESKENRIPT